MASNRRAHIQHVKSNVVVDGKPKLPTADVLLEGEIAVNYASGYETLSIKSDEGDIVTFSDDVQIKRMITEAVESGGTFDPDNYYDKAETDYQIGVATVNKADTTAVTQAINAAVSGKADTSDMTTAITQATSGKANSSDVYTTGQTYTKSEVDSLIGGAATANTFVTEAIPSGNSTDVKVILKRNDNVEVPFTLGSATQSTAGLMSASDKQRLDAGSFNDTYVITATPSANTTVVKVTLKRNDNVEVPFTLGSASSIAAGLMSSDDFTKLGGIASGATKVTTDTLATWGVPTKASYNSTTQKIEFSASNNTHITSMDIDATAFIKDGMIESVSAGTSGSTTVLVIEWNADAGSATTILDIGDMFEASNYYTTAQTYSKTEIDNIVTSGGTFVPELYYTKTDLTGSTNYATVRMAYSASTASTAVNATNATNALSATSASTVPFTGVGGNSTTGLVKVTSSGLGVDTNTYATQTYVGTQLQGYSQTGHTHYTNQITLSAYTLGTNVAVADGDSLNTALGKLQKQINESGGGTPTSDVPVKAEYDGDENQIIFKNTNNTTLTAMTLDTSAFSVGYANNAYRASGATSATTAASATSASTVPLSGISAMTGYQKASSSGAISTSDSLKTAIGKLEKTLDDTRAALAALRSDYENSLNVISAALNDLNIRVRGLESE